MIIKSYIPLYIILGLAIISIIISLLTFFTYNIDNDGAVTVSVAVGLGFLGISFGAFAFYGLVKAIYRKRLRALISWVVLLGIYLTLTFVPYSINYDFGSMANGILFIGLIVMGINEVWQIWQTRKPKPNSQSQLGLS